MDTQNPEAPATAATDATESDPIKQLIKRAREMNKTPRSPVITPNSTGAKYARAL